jgi:putative N6-adenine-specific DNA methylase
MASSSDRNTLSRPTITDKRFTMSYSFFCPCPRGLESALAEELSEIALQSRTLKIHNKVPGGVHCSGILQDAMLLNLYSRIASRVLLRIAQSSYASEDDVFKLALAPSESMSMRSNRH